MVEPASAPSWLGRPEDQRLEYKSAEALAHPETIVRACVAFMNADGGTVVVGVDDKWRPHAVSDPARQRDRLESILVDRVDPTPVGLVEVTVAIVNGVSVLEVSVGAGRDLHAERRRGLLGFWVRSGATTRSLRVHEVEARLMRTSPAAPPTAACGPLRRDAPRPALVLTAIPETAVGWRAKEIRAGLDGVTSSLAALDIRPRGFTVLPPADVPVRPRRTRDGGVELGERGSYKWLRVETSGYFVFEGYAPFLAWERLRPTPTGPLNTYPLIEGPSSFAKVVGAIGEQRDVRGPVRLGLELAGAPGWKVRAYKPGTIGWHDAALFGNERDLGSDSLVCEHLSDWSRLREQPDREALRLVEELWDDTLGFEVDAIPFWEEDRGRFNFG